ncbi:P-loop containing nucleoside triphosphate hydrolase protein [Mycena amicta]|nr:P-loop containing nucleoside triphosphate hydrolase protein [Mycena amicta]
MLAARTIFFRSTHLMIPAAASPASRSRRHRPRNHPPSNAAGSPRPMASAATATLPTPTPSAFNTQSPTPVPQSSLARDESHFSAKRFADAHISEASKQGIKYEFMSDVQASTIDYALAGHDLLVQAKTGTGKTLAFLLPSVERISKMTDLQSRKISMLVLSPTRELALQIEEEAQSLISKHPFKVGHAIGGTNMNSFGRRLLETPPTILIATPGRLVDHLENTPNFAHLFNDLRVIVYDEADRLLDAGFKRELDKILNFLPDKTKVHRQALLFSATVSQEIKGVAKAAMAANYKFISTLKEDEVNTHEHVHQQSLIVPFSKHLAATFSFLQQDQELHSGSTKAMIFLPTARAVGFFYEALSQLPRGTLPPIYEIHSRKSQPQRTKAAEAFKDAKQGVLISSDVTARGMDFPGVTLIIQTGLPANAEQYVHRLGRTARAGAGGRGILILSEAESFFLRDRTVNGFGITPVPSTQADTGYYFDHTLLAQAMNVVQPLLALVSNETKAQVYRAFLGFYNGSLKGMRWTKEDLVRQGNAYAVEALGWTGQAPPDVERKTVGKMGLKGVPGLNIVVSPPRQPQQQRPRALAQ